MGIIIVGWVILIEIAHQATNKTLRLLSCDHGLKNGSPKITKQGWLTLTIFQYIVMTQR